MFRMAGIDAPGLHRHQFAAQEEKTAKKRVVELLERSAAGRMKDRRTR
jgi:hypothetical protein